MVVLLDSILVKFASSTPADLFGLGPCEACLCDEFVRLVISMSRETETAGATRQTT